MGNLKLKNVRVILRRLHEDLIFVEFDRNLNFILDDNLPDFIAHLKIQ